jgi:dGTPase
MDMEDAHRLKIVQRNEVVELFMDVIRSINRTEENADKIYRYFNDITDLNEGISFLRAKLINVLTLQSADIFLENKEAILEGAFNDTLVDQIEAGCTPLKTINQVSLEKIYQHDTVMQIEIAGYNVMSELLKLFIPALLKASPSHKESKVLKLFPYQFTEYQDTENKFEKVMSALDYLSGMTDTYATELYRRLTGIVIPQHG